VAPQVYSVAGAKALPAWLSEKKARAAKRDPDYARRIELVQDLGFPGACQRLKLSPDGSFLFASGTHPPRVCPENETIAVCRGESAAQAPASRLELLHAGRLRHPPAASERMTTAWQMARCCMGWPNAIIVGVWHGLSAIDACP